MQNSYFGWRGRDCGHRKSGNLAVSGEVLLFSREPWFDRRWSKEAETENPHNIYEPIELLYLPNWKEHTGVIIQAYHDIMTEMEFWEKYAKESKFMSGDEFRMVDCAFYPILAYMIHRGLDLKKNGFPALMEYAESCRHLRVVLEARPEGWEEYCFSSDDSLFSGE
jgi:glutathione S-transferase